MSSSVHVDNKGKDPLIFREDPTQGLGEEEIIFNCRRNVFS